MNDLSNKLNCLTAQFTMTAEQITVIAESFRQEMVNGLAGKPSSLKMLPSYLGKPSGQEVGTFLALDFGGTNVRSLVAELLGQGLYKVHAHITTPLKDDTSQHNYISNQATAEQLFDFIVLQLGTLAPTGTNYFLGHTFSFPTHQTGLNAGVLLHWTKEIETTDVVGHNITNLLTAALQRNSLTHIVPKAIINDTVGTLLAAAYHDGSTHIGSICGTGHNTAYIEESAPLTNSPMIINLESGNFNDLPITTYDVTLDASSEKPGSQRLEKMVSGHYIGELLRLIICHLFEVGLLPASTKPKQLTVPYALTGAHLSLVQQDSTPDLLEIAHWLENSLFITNSSYQDRYFLQSIASLITTRSAQLVAATYIGIIKHIDPNLVHHHTIAIDGSLYEKMPGYAKIIQNTLQEALSSAGATATTSLIKDGSGIGAAIAAAIGLKISK